MTTFKVFDLGVLIFFLILTLAIDIGVFLWRIPIDGIGGAACAIAAVTLFTFPLFLICRLFTFFHVPNMVTMTLYAIVHLFIASSFMNATPTRTNGMSESIDNANKEVRAWQEEYKRVNGHYF